MSRFNMAAAAATSTLTNSNSHVDTPPELDHEISLVDDTSQGQTPAPASGTATPTTPASPTTNAPLTRKWTLREELARRKYSKWQGRAPDDPLTNIPTQTDDPAPQSDNEPLPPRPSTDNPRPPLPLSSQSEIDILFENQRGTFLFGTPYFSHKSLLNLDPSPWSTSTLSDSPVDILTAQLPDPTTWRWAWARWYVDMSADVDDEGWQYSFSFSRRFSWHGIPVWFHGFVRRRRWLRKRVRRHLPSKPPPPTSADYFTVLSASLSASGGSSLAPAIPKPHPRGDDDDDASSELDSISSLPALLSALKHALIDREKLLAANAFARNAAAEELVYLSERMEDIVQSLTFQASRRQLAADLLRAYDETLEKDGEGMGVRSANLKRASEAADRQVRGLEYWSDVRELVAKGETKGGVDPGKGWGGDEKEGGEWTGVDESGAPDGTERELPGGKGPADDEEEDGSSSSSSGEPDGDEVSVEGENKPLGTEGGSKASLLTASEEGEAVRADAAHPSPGDKDENEVSVEGGNDPSSVDADGDEAAEADAAHANPHATTTAAQDESRRKDRAQVETRESDVD